MFKSIIMLLAMSVLTAMVQAETIKEYLKKSDDWFSSAQAGVVLDNIISWQDKHGGWPKGVDTCNELYKGERSKLVGTFDNNATVSELSLLARAIHLKENADYRKSFEQGLDLLFLSQYPTGGWPQSYPVKSNYRRHITFNDNTMANIMTLLYDINHSEVYSFLDPARHEKAQAAFNAAVDCVIKCQVVVDGKLTVWCAQHDELDYQPRSARTFEPKSLSGDESGRMLCLLMKIEKPSEPVVKAIEAGVQWFKDAGLSNVGLKEIDGVLTYFQDPNAPVCWARFYEIETNRPIFLNRDSVVHYSFNELEKDGRNGYEWYGNWGQKVADAYIKWKKK